MNPKSATRKTFLTIRDSYTETERARFSKEACQRLSDLIDLKKPKVLHSFIPFSTEVDISRFLNELPNSIKLVTPKSLEKPKMAHYVTADLNRLTIGKYGIKEVDSTEIYEGTYDIILVPGLVFSADGYRVGYGGGYYDFFLAHHPEALKVGVGFPFQLAEKIPVEKHDVQLDKLILGSTLINIK